MPTVCPDWAIINYLGDFLNFLGSIFLKTGPKLSKILKLHHKGHFDLDMDDFLPQLPGHTEVYQLCNFYQRSFVFQPS